MPRSGSGDQRAVRTRLRLPTNLRAYVLQALPLFVGVSIVQASNYLFHMVVSRFLGPADYGALAALLGIVLIITVAQGVIQAAVAKKVSVLRAEGRTEEILSLGAGMLKAAFAFSLTASVVLFLFSPAIASFLHIGLAPALLLAVYTLVGALVSVPLGVLQGQLRFKAMALVLLLGVSIRLGVGIGLAGLGFGVTGAVLGTVAGATVAAGIGIRLLGIPSASWTAGQGSLRLMWADLRIALLGLATFRLFAVIDDVLARHYLAPRAGGIYSSAWIIANAILFLPGGIVLAALPRFAETAGRGEAARRWLRAAVLGVALVVLVALPVVILLRHQIVAVAFGSQYAGAAEFLPTLATTNALQAIVLVLTYFHIGAGTRGYRLALVGALAKILLISWFHRSPAQIALVVLSVDAVIAVLLYHSASAVARWRPPLEGLEAPLGEPIGRDGSKVDLTVVLPTHNAAPGLARVLKDLESELSGTGSYEVIVVSDGSMDETVEVARSTGSPHVRVVDLPTRGGKGSALRVGLAQARGDYVAFMDADGDIHPSSLRPFVSIMQLYRPDMVFGSKRHPLSEVSYPMSRRIMSWTYHKLTRLLFRVNVRDTQTGLKMIRRDVLAAVLPRMLEKRFAFDLELLVVARLLGFTRVFEAPVRLDYRFATTVTLGTVGAIVRDTLAIFYRRYVLGTYADSFRAFADIPGPARTSRRMPLSPSRRSHLRILFLNWRDIRNPEAGGAEILTHEIAKRWVEAGHQVTLLTSAFRGSMKRELVDGVEVRRLGRLRTGSFHLLVQKELGHSENFDVVIDEINTIPYFTPLRRHKLPPIVGLIHQLAQDVWDAELPRPLAAVGRALEPRFLRVYRDIPMATVSPSTKSDLNALGIRNVEIIPEGRDDAGPINNVMKEPVPTLLFVGRLTRNKRPDHAIKAFRHVKSVLPEARLWIVGRGPMERELRRDLPDGAEMLGYVPRAELYERMARSHCLLVPSVREGWGLVVVEANSVGTPAVGYDVPGVRDSIRHHQTGLLAPAGDDRALADQALTLLQDRELHATMAGRAIEWSRGFSWDASAARLMSVVKASLTPTVPETSDDRASATVISPLAARESTRAPAL
ncbi:MAG TPA: glycosyltransferase [Actinomycetota bacterium]|nr:glycosyltransferase [Actinomycetota bacterium]